MKVSVKTLKGTHFQIDVKPDDAVADVKKHIETLKGSDVYPAAQQMLIHQGKVLKDDTTLEENKVAENSFIVIMLSKNKVSTSGGSSTSGTTANTVQPAAAASQATQPVTESQASAATVPPLQPAPESTPAPAPSSSPSPSPSSAPAPSPSPAPAATATAAPAATATAAPAATATAAPASSVTDAYGQAASNLVAGSTLESTIQQILDMGGGSWDRDTVVRALRAAYNNPERAVDYLYSGIPEAAEVPPPAQAPASAQAVNPSAQAPQQPVPSSGPNANPLDLFPQGIPTGGSNASAGSLDFLRNSQQFQALRAMVQANPQILQPMLQELGKQNPHLMRLIQEHQADFLRLINEPVEGEGNILGQLAEAMPQAVTVTPEEREAIERLEAMGFERALVLEVYFACNKNEELAANYLLDHMHEFEE